MSAPRRLIASFVLLLILPAAAVVWLGTRLLSQDGELEARQLEERRNSAADRAVAGLEQALSASERRLQSYDLPHDPDDGVILSIREGRVQAYPAQRLLYYPEARSVPEPTDVFAAAETLEFRDGDHSRAAAAFRELAASSSPQVRAGALLRLARNLRRLNRRDEAKAVYRELSRIETVTLDGVPADLVARRALLELEPETSSQKDALVGDLLAGRWRLDRATFLAYLGDRPVPAEREALAEAAAWVAHVPEASGRRAPHRLGGRASRKRFGRHSRQGPRSRHTGGRTRHHFSKVRARARGALEERSGNRHRARHGAPHRGRPQRHDQTGERSRSWERLHTFRSDLGLSHGADTDRRRRARHRDGAGGGPDPGSSAVRA